MEAVCVLSCDESVSPLAAFARARHLVARAVPSSHASSVRAARVPRSGTWKTLSTPGAHRARARALARRRRCLGQASWSPTRARSLCGADQVFRQWQTQVPSIAHAGAALPCTVRQALHGRAQPSCAAEPSATAELRAALWRRLQTVTGQSVALAGTAGPSAAMSGAAE